MNDRNPITESLARCIKKLAVMQGIGARHIRSGRDPMTSVGPYDYVILDGINSQTFHTENGFTPEEINQISDALDLALKQIFLPRIARTLEEIHTLSTPL